MLTLFSSICRCEGLLCAAPSERPAGQGAHLGGRRERDLHGHLVGPRPDQLGRPEWKAGAFFFLESTYSADPISSPQLGLTKNPGNNPLGNFRFIPNGLPGVETRPPLLWSEGVCKGRISRTKFVELISTNAAKLYGMYPQSEHLPPSAHSDAPLTSSSNRGYNPARK